MEEELIYQLSLTQIPELGPVLARVLLEKMGSASAIFRARKKELSSIEGIGEIRAGKIRQFNNHRYAEKELAFAKEHGIEVLFLTDKSYPARLRNCYDAPMVLFYKGKANLNASRIISMVGTRHNTDYGRWAVETIVAALKPLQVTIISGLAFGIDAITHRQALQQGLPTIGVMAHGMHTIYPLQHKNLAKEMLVEGGLLTEFGTGQQPDRHHFPQRNRIVAGMADVTLVIETAAKGGSMITADLAFQYNRDLFVIPGRINDSKSSGCLALIAANKAMPFISVAHMAEVLGWKEKKKQAPKQRILFAALSDDEQQVLTLLQQTQPCHIDTLCVTSKLSSSRMAGALLGLEMHNLIRQLPGKYYQVCD